MGCLRGVFDGGGLTTDWLEENGLLQSPAFDAELRDLLETLQCGGPLENFQSMRQFCLGHPQARMSGRQTFYAFRIDTQRSHDAFVSHVTGVFNNDEALSERTVGDLEFAFRGGCAVVQYTFARRDKDAASAEMFSKQCVLDARDQLEGYGCKIEKIECFAEALDHVRERAGDRGTQERKRKGNRHDR